MTKHTPATPLPYRSADFTIQAVSHGQWFTVARTNEPRFTPEARKQHAAYLAHAANAYPALVDALRGCIARAERGTERAQCFVERALLRELGEDA